MPSHVSLEEYRLDKKMRWTNKTAMCFELIGIYTDEPVYVRERKNDIVIFQYGRGGDYISVIGIFSKDMIANGPFRERYNKHWMKRSGVTENGELHGRLFHYRESDNNIVKEYTDFVDGDVHGESAEFFSTGDLHEMELFDKNIRYAILDTDFGGNINEIKLTKDRRRHGISCVKNTDFMEYIVYQHGKHISSDAAEALGREDLRDLTDEELLILELRFGVQCDLIMKLRKSYLR